MEIETHSEQVHVDTDSGVSLVFDEFAYNEEKDRILTWFRGIYTANITDEDIIDELRGEFGDKKESSSLMNRVEGALLGLLSPTEREIYLLERSGYERNELVPDEFTAGTYDSAKNRIRDKTQQARELAKELYREPEGN